jgi:hypothetical protein
MFVKANLSLIQKGNSSAIRRNDRHVERMASKGDSFTAVSLPAMVLNRLYRAWALALVDLLGSNAAGNRWKRWQASIRRASKRMSERRSRGRRRMGGHDESMMRPRRVKVVKLGAPFFCLMAQITHQSPRSDIYIFNTFKYVNTKPRSRLVTPETMRRSATRLPHFLSQHQFIPPSRIKHSYSCRHLSTTSPPAPTPLALTLTAQIKVAPSKTPNTDSPERRAHSITDIHIPMPHSPRSRILHYISRPVWREGRLHHIPRNLANVW